jgi:hypothetical protein
MLLIEGEHGAGASVIGAGVTVFGFGLAVMEFRRDWDSHALPAAPNRR